MPGCDGIFVLIHLCYKILAFIIELLGLQFQKFLTEFHISQFYAFYFVDTSGPYGLEVKTKYEMPSFVLFISRCKTLVSHPPFLTESCLVKVSASHGFSRYLAIFKSPISVLMSIAPTWTPCALEMAIDITISYHYNFSTTNITVNKLYDNILREFEP